jgi:hypothetical protein
MGTALQTAIANGLSASQILIPDTVAPRFSLSTFRLNSASIMRILRPSFLHLTNTPASHLLQTPMRDTSLYAFDLRTAHEATGFHLALTILTPLLGLGTYPIPHVQDNPTNGFRVLNKATTLIVPLMRGGEPMAFGVAHAFKTAAFAHARV